MNKDVITDLLKEKLAAKLAEKKKEVAEKVIKESDDIQFATAQFNSLDEAVKKIAIPEMPAKHKAYAQSKQKHNATVHGANIPDEIRSNRIKADNVEYTKSLVAKHAASNDPKEKEQLKKAINFRNSAIHSKTPVELKEDHFSEDEIEKLLAKFEKEQCHDGLKAVEDYISAEADGNKAAAAKAAAKIKKLK